MKHFSRKSILFFMIAAAIGGMVLIARNGTDRERETATPNDVPVVAATIFPLYDMVRAVAGEAVEVRLIVPPGTSPHTFSVSPALLRQLSGASTVFAIGGVDEWVVSLTNTLPDIRTVNVDTYVNKRYDDDGNVDPHYWLSGREARNMVRAITEELIREFPDRQAAFEANARMYDERLRKMDEGIRTQLAELPVKNTIMFHDSWGYFARDYGLTIVGVFEETPGAEPSAQDIARLSTLVTKYHIPAIFIEPQLATQTVKAIADDLGVIVAVLDPIGGVEGRETYIDLMRYNADTIREAFGEKYDE